MVDDMDKYVCSICGYVYDEEAEGGCLCGFARGLGLPPLRRRKRHV